MWESAYLWFKRLLLLAWLIATTIFTINANETEGIQNNIAADIVAAILLFNLIPWLISYRRWRKRKRMRERALNPAGAFDENYVTPVRSRRRANIGFAISLIVFVVMAGGIYQWSAQQIAILNDSPTPTYLDSFEKGAADPKLVWTQVAQRNKSPLTWHTCKKIKVFVNPGEVKSAVGDVKEVIDEINQLTSLNFYYAGLTTKQPFVDINNEYEVVVGFYSEEEASEGFKFKEAVGLGSADGYFGEVVSGGIGIRTPAYQKANRGLRKEILLHEFGHVLGLDHVNKKNELMSIQVNGSKTAFNKETKEYFLAHPGCVEK
jgi:hypothetical protein